MRNNDVRRNYKSASLADANTNDLGPGLSRIEVPFGSLFIRIMWKTRDLQNFRLFSPQISTFGKVILFWFLVFVHRKVSFHNTFQQRHKLQTELVHFAALTAVTSYERFIYDRVLKKLAYRAVNHSIRI